jgi:hypothetical protein
MLRAVLALPALLDATDISVRVSDAQKAFHALAGFAKGALMPYVWEDTPTEFVRLIENKRFGSR